MQFLNTQDRYGIVTIIFHWLMALLIIGMLALGLYMTNLPRGMYKLQVYGWHKSIGLTILVLALLRFAWLVKNILPMLTANMPEWQRRAARFVHYSFYALMIAMPLSGWLMSSAAGVSVSFFGLFVMPDLINPDPHLKSFFANLHEWFAWILIALILLHIAAVFQHYIVYKDPILRRMLP